MIASFRVIIADCGRAVPCAACAFVAVQAVKKVEEGHDAAAASRRRGIDGLECPRGISPRCSSTHTERTVCVACVSTAALRTLKSA